MSVSVEVMDCSFGRPAEGVSVTLLREVDARWRQEACSQTDEAGCVAALPAAVARGRYRLVLDFDKYFPALGVSPFQSRVDVTFRVFEVDEVVHFLVTVTPSSSAVCRLVSGSHAHR